ASHRVRQRGLPPPDPQEAAPRDRASRGRGPRACAAHRLRAPAPAPALGWGAATGRPRPSPCLPAPRAPHGRAPGRARQEAPPSSMRIEPKHIPQRVHVSVIYATHDQEEALTMSDRVAVMQGGRIEQVGTPAELYDRPASRFVADFLGESNFLDAVVVAAEPGGHWRCRTASGLEFRGMGAAALAAGQLVTAAVRPAQLLP